MKELTKSYYCFTRGEMSRKLYRYLNKEDINYIAEKDHGTQWTMLLTDKQKDKVTNIAGSLYEWD